MIKARFATALASALDDSATVQELTAPLCVPVVRPGREKADGTRTKSRQFRGLNPLSPDDLKLRETVPNPDFTISGLHDFWTARFLDCATKTFEWRYSEPTRATRTSSVVVPVPRAESCRCCELTVRWRK